jgi:hypothetical protein
MGAIIQQGHILADPINGMGTLLRSGAEVGVGVAKQLQTASQALEQPERGGPNGRQGYHLE